MHLGTALFCGFIPPPPSAPLLPACSCSPSANCFPWCLSLPLALAVWLVPSLLRLSLWVCCFFGTCQFVGLPAPPAVFAPSSRTLNLVPPAWAAARLLFFLRRLRLFRSFSLHRLLRVGVFPALRPSMGLAAVFWLSPPTSFSSCGHPLGDLLFVRSAFLASRAAFPLSSSTPSLCAAFRLLLLSLPPLPGVLGFLGLTSVAAFPARPALILFFLPLSRSSLFSSFLIFAFARFAFRFFCLLFRVVPGRCYAVLPTGASAHQSLLSLSLLSLHRCCYFRPDWCPCAFVGPIHVRVRPLGLPYCAPPSSRCVLAPVYLFSRVHFLASSLLMTLIRLLVTGSRAAWVRNFAVHFFCLRCHCSLPILLSSSVGSSFASCVSLNLSCFYPSFSLICVLPCRVFSCLRPGPFALRCNVPSCRPPALTVCGFCSGAALSLS